VTSAAWFAALVGLVGLERVVEVVVARRNAAWSLARGGVEAGRGHYGPMVALHTALLAGCLAEVLLRAPDFVPALGWPALGAVVAALGLRWWCVATLGRQWTTRVIVVPGLGRVTRGPYRWLRHPNYAAVVVEGLALPLVHGAWFTAAVFTALNGALLTVRIRTEEAALTELREAPA